MKYPLAMVTNANGLWYIFNWILNIIQIINLMEDFDSNKNSLKKLSKMINTIEKSNRVE